MRFYKGLVVAIPISLLLWALIVWVAYAGDKPEHNAKWSHQRISTLVGVPLEELNNSTIFMSSFYREGSPGRDVFPAGVVNLWLEQSNLDNVIVPSGVTMINCSNRQIHAQNDMDDWTVEYNGVTEKWEPQEPLNKKQRIASGISILPKDIPENPLTEKEREEFENEIEFGAGVTEPPGSTP